MLRNNYLILVSVVLYFLFYEFKIANCSENTFIKTSVEWCNGSSEHDRGRICEKTFIEESNSLVNRLPNSAFSYIGILNQNIPVLQNKSLSNIYAYKLEIISDGISEIEVGALKNLSAYDLSISRNNIDRIRNGTFTESFIRGTLDLSENVINTIEDGVFIGMRLGTLDLSLNVLEDIPPGAFKDLIVEHIALNGNKLKRLSRELFCSLKSMQLLSLHDNQISVLDAGALKNMISPAFVYLHNNSIETIPTQVFNDLIYTQLLLSNNKIKSISPGAFNASAFVYLNISENCLEEVKKDSFDGVLHITYLMLAKNRIKDIEPRALDVVGKGVQLAYNDLEIVKKHAIKYPQYIVLLNNTKLRKIETDAFNNQDLDVKYHHNPHKNKVRHLYIEPNNNLDGDSKEYVKKLNESGQFWLHDKVTGLLFPFE